MENRHGSIENVDVFGRKHFPNLCGVAEFLGGQKCAALGARGVMLNPTLRFEGHISAFMFVLFHNPPAGIHAGKRGRETKGAREGPTAKEYRNSMQLLQAAV